MALDLAWAQSHPAASAVGLLVVLFILQRIYLRVQEELQIKALGGHAPSVRTWPTFGVNFIVRAVRYAMRYDDRTFWIHNFGKYANPAHPFTIEIRVCGIRVINTIDEENIKAILATQFQDFGKGEKFHEDFHDFLGDSIFTTDGQRWSESRALIRPQFIKDRVSDLQVFETHVSVLLPLLRNQRQPSQSVDVANLFYRLTLDAATDFLLGESVDSLVNETSRFAEAFGEVQRIQSLIARASQIKQFIPMKSFYQGLKDMDEFIQPIIERALRLSPEELEKKSKHDEGYNFLYAVAAYTRDRKVLRDQLTAVLLAGRDTTACTLSWMFYHLSMQPQTYAKLRQEILARVGKNKLPTYDDLKSMRYLQHAINETLRLYPIVPYNMRMALKDTTLPRGGGPDGKSPIGVRANTPVGYSTIQMQHRADIYPPASPTFADYREFSPERWDHWTPKAWTYIPFNGGPRICVGQQFAITEIAYTTTRILQTYSGLELRMSKVPSQKAEIVLSPHEGVHVVFHPDGEKE